MAVVAMKGQESFWRMVQVCMSGSEFETLLMACHMAPTLAVSSICSHMLVCCPSLEKNSESVHLSRSQDSLSICCLRATYSSWSRHIFDMVRKHMHRVRAMVTQDVIPAIILCGLFECFYMLVRVSV